VARRALLALLVAACHAQHDAPREMPIARDARPSASAADAVDGRVTRAVPDTPATELVRKLIAQPPARMSELEALVGPIGMSFRSEDHENMGMLIRPRGNAAEFSALVPRLSVRYAWDKYHQDPNRPRDVPLRELFLEIRGDAGEAEQLLRQRFGAPRTVVQKLASRDSLPASSTAEGGAAAIDDAPSVTYLAFHPFYLERSTPADRFRLTWYAEVPRFAIPEPDPKARAAWLRALAHQIATAKSVDDIDAFCKTAPAAAGIEITGTLNTTANPYGLPAKDPRDYWIKLVPPVRANVVVDSFGWAPAVGVSHDVHMSSWHVERRGAGWLPVTGADAQWQVQASLAGWPSGPQMAGSHGPNPAYEIGEHDEIGALAIQPRFK
jgi:hypothetical protein